MPLASFSMRNNDSKSSNNSNNDNRHLDRLKPSGPKRFKKDLKKPAEVDGRKRKQVVGSR